MKYMLITALLAFSCISSTAQEEILATASTTFFEEVEQRPTPNRGPCFYQQPLNKAIYKGELPFIKKLIEEYGTSCMPIDAGNRTPLHVALREHEGEQMANYLLNHEMQYEAQDEDGNTVLHVAVLRGKSDDFIEKLLAKDKVPLNARNKLGRTAFHEAVIVGASEQVIKGLVAFAVAHEDDYNDEDSLFDAQDIHGNTVAHLAVLHEHSRHLLEQFLSFASSNICNNNNRTPLEEAIHLGAEDAARKLIAHGAGFRQNKEGDFPLFAAIKKRDQKLFNLIVRLKAIANEHDQFNYNPLHAALFYAKDQSDEPMIRTIMDNTPSTIQFEVQQDVDGRTPLHIVMMTGSSGRFSKALINKIIQRTPENIRTIYDNNGNTPIHTAVLHGFMAGIKALVEANVSITLPNKVGKTPLELTFDNIQGGGYQLIGPMVRECGADANMLVNCEAAGEPDGNQALRPILYSAAIARKTEHLKALRQCGAVYNHPKGGNVLTLIEARNDRANLVNEIKLIKNT